MILLGLLCVNASAVDPVALIRDLASPAPGVRRNAAEGAKQLPTTPALIQALLHAAKTYPGIEGSVSGTAQESVFAALAQHGKDDPATVNFFFRTRIASLQFDAEGISESAFQTAFQYWDHPTPAMKKYVRGMLIAGDEVQALSALELMGDGGWIEKSDFPLVDTMVRSQLTGDGAEDLSYRGQVGNLYTALFQAATLGYRSPEALEFAAQNLTDPKNYTADNSLTLVAMVSTLGEMDFQSPKARATLEKAEAIAQSSGQEKLAEKIQSELSYLATGQFNPRPDPQAKTLEVLKNIRRMLRQGDAPQMREFKNLLFSPEHIRRELLNVPAEQRLTETRKLIRAMMKSGDADIRRSAVDIVEKLYLDGPKGWKEVLADSPTCNKILNLLRKLKRIE